MGKKQKVNVRNNETGQNKVGYITWNGDAKVGLFKVWKKGTFTINAKF